MYRYIYIFIYACVCVLQGHGEADRRLSPGVGGRGRSPLINILNVFNHLEKSMGRIIPYIMENNSRVWNHQAVNWCTCVIMCLGPTSPVIMTSPSENYEILALPMGRTLTNSIPNHTQPYNFWGGCLHVLSCFTGRKEILHRTASGKSWQILVLMTGGP